MIGGAGGAIADASTAHGGDARSDARSPSEVDPTESEQAAITAALAPLGEYIASIGMERPLADYSRDEVLTLIEVAVIAFRIT